MTEDHPACTVCGKPSSYIDIDGRQSHESCAGESSETRRAAKIESRGGKVSPRWSNGSESRSIMRIGPSPTLAPMSSAERSRRYRARKAGQDVPKRQPGRKKPINWFDYARIGADSVQAEIVRSQPSMSWPEALDRLGVNRDPQRVQDLLAAYESREKVDREQTRRQIEALASAVRKCRRNADLAFSEWKAQPSTENLERVDQFNRARAYAESELRERCANDQGLIDEALRQAYGR
jgi:hypothetical protein